jgi:hypothetical protein
MILLTSNLVDVSHEKFAVVLSEKDDGWVGLCIINTYASTETKKKNFQIKLLCKDYPQFLELSDNSYSLAPLTADK